MGEFLVSVPGQLLLLIGSMILLAVGTALQKHRLRHERNEQPRLPAPISTPTPVALTITPSAYHWLRSLRDALHVLVIGHSRGGKTRRKHRVPP